MLLGNQLHLLHVHGMAYHRIVQAVCANSNRTLAYDLLGLNADDELGSHDPDESSENLRPSQLEHDVEAETFSSQVVGQALAEAARQLAEGGNTLFRYILLALWSKARLPPDTSSYSSCYATLLPVHLPFICPCTWRSRYCVVTASCHKEL